MARERQERFDRFFAAADADGDGLLSKAELQAAIEAELQAALRTLDDPHVGRPLGRGGPEPDRIPSGPPGHRP